MIVIKLIKCLKFSLTALLIPSKLSSLFFRLKLMQCKFCKFTHAVEAVLLKHYRLHHRGSTWPCIHRDCCCTFRTISALKSHLSRLHRTVQRQENLSFQCWLCEYKDICCKKKVLIHLLVQFK